MDHIKLAFIGGGNMARAIIGGLLNKGFKSDHMIVFEPNPDSQVALQKDFGIQIAATNKDAVYFKSKNASPSSLSSSGNSNNQQPANVIVLAVKPQVMKVVAEGLAASVQETNPLIVSIAAGIRVLELNKWLGGQVSIVRTMPNTPALVGEGATAMYANESVSNEQKQSADTVLGAISACKYWVEKETLLDVVTGLSGSGPAYFFLLIESIEAAAISLGLPLEIARGLAIQTCLGAGKMAATADCDPAELRRRVTSPNGTTEAAVKTAESLGMRDLWLKAVTSATKRSEELGQQMANL